MREPVLRLESERPSAYSSTAAGLLAVGQRRDAELGNHRLRNGKADDGGQQAGRADEADERLAAEDPAAVVGTAGGRHGIDDGRDEVERQHDEPVLMSAFQPFLVLLFWFGSEQIHSSLFEAAICEGASTRQCFFRIYIPLLSPYILAGSLLSVVESWNMLEQPMTFLQTDSQMVLSTYFLQQTGASPIVTATQALVSVLPLLLVFAFAVVRLHNPIFTVSNK